MGIMISLGHVCPISNYTFKLQKLKSLHPYYASGTECWDPQTGCVLPGTCHRLPPTTTDQLLVTED